MVEEICVLGSTGSIGAQTLEVCQSLNIKVNALSAGSNIKLLAEQARRFLPKKAVIADESKYRELKLALADCPVEVMSGREAVCEIAAFHNKNETVLNAIVGIAGLLPTLAAAGAGKRLALANKESLVAGGELVISTAKNNGGSIFPVDSEHSAIFQCLSGNNSRKNINKIILTASGGPFFGKTRGELQNIKPEDALKHPNWSMGRKITIDSATMMNKGFEVIEAVRLFDLKPEQIEIVVHRESVIHSAVEFADGAVIAQLGEPDMKIPIQLALTWPDRFPAGEKKLSLAAYGSLSFCEPDMKTFYAPAICIKAVGRGGLAPCVVNGANEAAVGLFLEGKASFPDIADLAGEALEQLDLSHLEKGGVTIEKILEADALAREFAVSRAARNIRNI
ncbi:MAG: 1-deoxy-D-xylulose-5-phosphate reductoisomerase [Oscillospiraceae bacterium]|jgi:1-deoxy-D-xylulose-5-phosphate reductoisomerase|nr:1-deoxy-D-xylulose-5-phosphate reductoisomerase [Oscillospiraceae bacterium]